MMKTKIFNSILIFITIFCSICYSIETVLSYNLYGSLIRLSIIPVILLPCIIRKLFKFKISPMSEFIYIVFVFLGHFLGSVVNLYSSIYWYDTFIHFLSGILVFFLGFEFLVRTNKYDKNKIYFNILFLIAFSFMIAGTWEFFEFTNDYIFGKDAQKVIDTGVTDTMKDMIMAILGTILCTIEYYREFKINKNYIFMKFFKNIDL